MPEHSLSTQQRWAMFKFGVVASLLARPPEAGRLAAELRQLSERVWPHPITGEPSWFSFKAIERWLLQARSNPQDPVGALRRKVRGDAGSSPAMPEDLRRLLRQQHGEHPCWSYKLHYKNLAACVREDPDLGRLPSYPTIRRYMQANGLRKRKRRRSDRDTPGAHQARQRLERREVRSYEVENVGELWHADYHLCSRSVLLPDARWVTPWLFAVIDDHSRLVCHAQWYLRPCAENTYHALAQALARRGLPWRLMHDRGSEFCAGEIQQGLPRLGITPEPTLPYSPYQNAKIEIFWLLVEGELMPMVEGRADLALAELNYATHAWIEHEYHRALHSQTRQTPLDRFTGGPCVLRDSLPGKTVRLAFGLQETRRQRQGDGTISIDNVRFEIPSRYRHVRTLCVRYSRWDLSFVHLVDAKTEAILARIWPVDKAANADGRRRLLDAEPPAEPEALDTGKIAPLLKELIDRQAASGLPPAYLPKDERNDDTNPNTEDKENAR